MIAITNLLLTLTSHTHAFETFETFDTFGNIKNILIGHYIKTC